MKLVRKIITIFITIILFIILSFNIFSFVSIKVFDNKLPTIFGYSLLEVISGSMEPVIKKGDMVIIDTKVKEFKVNDIVTFEDINGSFVTHRIIELNHDKVVTKGDANNTIDAQISKDTIVGKYVYKITGIGALMNSLRSPFVLVMVLVIGILLSILFSTDSNGNVILTEEEKEYMEFLKQKNAKTVDTKPVSKTNTKKDTVKSNTVSKTKTSSVKPKTTDKKTGETKPVSKTNTKKDTVKSNTVSKTKTSSTKQRSTVQKSKKQ